MLEHYESSVEKSVGIELVCREGPCANGLFDVFHCLWVDVEVTCNLLAMTRDQIENIGQRGNTPWVNAFRNGVGVADTIHQARHHDFSQVGIRAFLIDADPRELAVPLGKGKV